MGEQVTRFRTGDRVIGRCVTHGAYAEFVCVEERFTVACPESISAEEGAALFVTGQTAFHALVTIGNTQSGDWVLITAAAGGAGTCAVQIARLLGANVIAAACAWKAEAVCEGIEAGDESRRSVRIGGSPVVNQLPRFQFQRLLRMKTKRRNR